MLYKERVTSIFWILLLSIGVSIVPGSRSVAGQCSVKSPADCSNIDELLNAGGASEVRTFLRGMSGVSAKKTASDDIIRVLGGPPQDRVDLHGGFLLFSACQIHNCDDKGILITSITGEIIAAGIIHYEKFPAPILTIFIHDPKIRSEIEAIAANWAQEQLDAQSAKTGEAKRTVDSVQIRLSSHPS